MNEIEHKSGQLAAVYMRRASPPKRAGLYFAFTWRASPSRRARHVGANNSNPIVLCLFYCFHQPAQEG